MHFKIIGSLSANQSWRSDPRSSAVITSDHGQILSLQRKRDLHKRVREGSIVLQQHYSSAWIREVAALGFDLRSLDLYPTMRTLANNAERHIASHRRGHSAELRGVEYFGLALELHIVNLEPHLEYLHFLWRSAGEDFFRRLLPMAGNPWPQ